MRVRIKPPFYNMIWLYIVMISLDILWILSDMQVGQTSQFEASKYKVYILTFFGKNKFLMYSCSSLNEE